MHIIQLLIAVCIALSNTTTPIQVQRGQVRFQLQSDFK